ncbi:FG-GAP-like repeat-containing protein [Actinomadura sp. HBU206391]|uniref:FG-GAP-like repeat-containing protein n=1 Tax=Actinomadura sp. HBU206391 TaxID=2731692 RepID=UPI001650B525|nr:FG-GAP-like repeat-containing protein [Actinomadura sp. HBU206391]MBC6459516.1 FG-GAP repeat protein [Actinomadura sp. HBU206391]
MRMRSAAVMGTVTALALGLTAPHVSAAAAPAAPGDFNGDGRRDIATGSPNGMVGSVQAGFVTIVYGGTSGPDTARRQVISQSSAGVPGDSEDSDRFGTALASADFDRDGYADLAIGAPGEDGFGDPLAGGRVTLVYGGPSGLSSRAVSFAEDLGGGIGVTLATADVDHSGTPDLAVGDYAGFTIYRGLSTGSLTGTRTHVGFGESENVHVQLAAADFTGDGYGDVAFSVFSVPIGGGDDYFTRLNAYKGTATGLSSTPFWSDGNATVRGALAAGDVDDDARVDLFVGDSYGSDGTGEVRTYLATGTGFERAQVITQDSTDIPGTGEQGDAFGASLGAGDVNGDYKDDVVIGAPGEDVGTVSNAGAVTVLYGASHGLAFEGSQMLGQDSAEMPGSAEAGDRFGQAASLADVNGDGKADLIAGSPGENTDEGAIWIVRGSSTGLTTAGVLAFNSGTLGVSGRRAQLGGVLLP